MCYRCGNPRPEEKLSDIQEEYYAEELGARRTIGIWTNEDESIIKEINKEVE